MQTHALSFVDQAQNLANHLQTHSVTPWLNDFRQTHWHQFHQMPWPTRKTEHWKYTQLDTLNQSLNTASSRSNSIELPDFNAQTIVFNQGEYDEARSSITLSDQAVDNPILLFSQASSEKQTLIHTYLSKNKKSSQHIFTRLNNSLLNDALLIHINQSLPASEPIHILHLNDTENDDSFCSHTRHLIIVEDQCEATIIEHFLSFSPQSNARQNQVTELFLHPHAKLNHYRLQLESEQSTHLGAVFAQLDKASELNSFYCGLGGELKRIDIDVDYLDVHAQAHINGVYLAKHQQHIDYHTNIEHQSPHCTTQEVFRGIIDDAAKAVFNGRIHIHPDAQKSLAELSNKNLLLSNKAEINTKPELEIYADDVRCAHGATISQMDESALFYLRSRGIDSIQAKTMLNLGFIQQLIHTLEQEKVKTYLLDLITHWLAPS